MIAGIAVDSSRMSVKDSAHRLDFFDRHPVARFVFLFLSFCGVFYAVWLVNTYAETGVFDAYLEANAHASAWVLRVFQESALANGQTLMTPRASLEIRAGCDALQPMALFVAGVVALATPLRAKLIGLGTGLSLIFILNLARIVSLYYVRIHWPNWFETMHVDVWQLVFIIFSFGLWTAWALWATKADTAPVRSTAAVADVQP